MEVEPRAMMMAAGNKGEHVSLMDELSQGMGLAQQLQGHLAGPSSPEMQRLLAEKILRCYEKVLSLLACPDINRGVAAGSLDSTEKIFSFIQESSMTSRIKHQQFPQNVSKKRKTLSPRCVDDVRVVTGTGPDGPPDDGYTWRKYGQKDILGSNFPRAYYRCTYRHVQGCLATKQVQRSDNDESLFEVAYRGRHTCRSSSSQSVVRCQLPITNTTLQKHNCSSRIETLDETGNQQSPDQMNLIKPDCISGLKLKTEIHTKEDTFPCFGFDGEVGMFGDALQDKSFLVPEVPEPGYLSMCNTSGLTSETDPNEIFSGQTSVTNSPTGHVFPFAHTDFDLLDFLLEDPENFL